MLRPPRHRAADARRPFLPYRCRAAAYPLHEVGAIPLGAHDAASPRLALRWLQERTRHVADQLDAPHAQPALCWLTDEAEHERALAYLTAGTGYQLTFHDENTRYVLVAHPTGAMP
ncbi:hypothetical protein GCM10010249_01200 [Streptomyces roseolilacinus]|uniref:Uncharacterized protein n=1 Tax=Streptomyces roseolilacinus TaxID=66904 RepID=A0A918AUW1_9ACTN|nr:hypothetical protein GCM10010249_01200 [Streptomyces roseolilacinus]